MLVDNSAECFITSPIWQSVDQTSRRTFRRLAQSLALCVPTRPGSLANQRHGSANQGNEASGVPYHLSKVERALSSSYLSVHALKSFLALELGDEEDIAQRQGKLASLSSFLSSSRMDLNISRGASPEAVPRGIATLNKWISLLVAVRQHAVLMLDGLEYMYCIQQAALRYWQWARRNPVSFHAHKLLSLPANLPAGSWAAIAPFITVATHPYLRWRSDNEIEASAAAHQLQRVEDWIVRCIGVVHTAMSTMNLSVSAYAASLASLSEDTELGISVGRDSGVDQVLQTIVRKTLSNMHMCPVLPGSAILGGEASPAGPPTTGGRSFEETSPTFDGLVRQLRHQVEWFDESRSAALALLNKSDLAVPPGRAWRRVAALFIMVVPVAIYACKTSPSATISHLHSVRSVLTTFYLGYVQEPLIAAYHSFTSVRPGAAQRKQEIEEDLNSTIRMVLDFYGDMVEGISTEERAAMEVAVRRGDMSMINGRYEAAVRHPFRSFFFGSMVRLMLIQIQQQKLEVSRVLSASDDVLESNDFNFKVMALMPFVAFVSLSLHYLATRSRHKRDPVYHRLRLCWRKLSRLLMSDEVERSPGDGLEDDICKIGELAEGIQVAHRVSSSAEVSTGEQGKMLLLIHEMRALMGCIPEYPLLDEMLEDLRDVESVEATRGRRLQVVNRMLNTHPVLNPLYISK